MTVFYSRQALLLPVRPEFIALTIATAFLLNLVPWPGIATRVHPDLVALVLLYWSVREPYKFGYTIAWLLGLAMDVAEGSFLGQHALAYTILVFSGNIVSRRMAMFGGIGQAMHAAPLLLLTDVVVLLIRLMAGADFPGWTFFAGSAVAACLWPFIAVLFRLPQLPKPDPDSGVSV